MRGIRLFQDIVKPYALNIQRRYKIFLSRIVVVLQVYFSFFIDWGALVLYTVHQKIMDIEKHVCVDFCS